MKRLLIQLSVFFLAALSTSADAQDVWTLQRCVNHAFQNNITINNADLALERSEIEVTRSRHNRYPSLNGSSGLNLNFGRTVDPTTNDFITQSFLSNNISLSSNMTIYNGGRINNTIQQSQLLRDAAVMDKQQIKNDIALQVAQTYLNVLFAEENLEINRQQLALSKEQLRQTQQLVDAGARPANEVLDVEAQIARNEQTIVSAENNVTITYLNLKQLLRLEPDYQLIVEKPVSLDVTLDPDEITFRELYNKALETQYFVKAGELRVQGANVAEDIAFSNMIPSLGVGGFLGTNFNNRAQRITGFNDGINEQTLIINGQEVEVGLPTSIPEFEDNPYFDQLDENLSYGFGLQLSVPIYNRYANKAAVEQAKLSTLVEMNTLQQQKENLKITVQQALADAIAAKRSYLASQKSENAARLSFENAQKRYDLGAINPIEYVTSKNQLENAQINLLISKYDYLFQTKVLDFYLGNPMNI